MMRLVKILVILIAICLFSHPFYLYAQEKQEAIVDSRQHYEQGKVFYSQGRYQEAADEFKKAETLLPPKLEFLKDMQEEQKKVLSPAPAQIAPSIRETAPEQAEKEKTEFQEALTKPEAVAGTAEKEYYIDIGDVLDISVWKIAELSRADVIVRPDGKISFPLIGDIKAEGLTITRLDDVITDKLKKYVKAPEVSIMIRQFGEQANKVIVLGEILVPGVYKFTAPPTITEVVASASGYTKYAVLNGILVIRGDIKTKPEVFRVDLAQILKSGKLTQNIFLKPNDIVYVPRSFIGKINTFLEILQPAIEEYMQTLNIQHLQSTVRRKSGL